jgi:glycosyltransferase involved in cell wall biosynthesis/SAM-dependent methyltransferase
MEKNKADTSDKILDAYYGSMGRDFMLKTRKRIHWIVQECIGTHILDAGCSQGIVPLLLAREGKNVLGIDVDSRAIDVANNQLKNESKLTQERAKFVNSDFNSLDFKNDKFDTIIISEVLEHLLNPRSFIEKSFDLLNKDGLLIITVPFGINDFTDHKKTYYFKDIYDLLSEFFIVEDFRVFGKWIGFKARHKNLKEIEPVKVNKRLLSTLESSFYDIERELVNSSYSLNDRITKLINSENIYKENNLKLTGSLNEANNKYKDSMASIALLKTSLSNEIELRAAKVNELTGSLNEANNKYKDSILKKEDNFMPMGMDHCYEIKVEPNAEYLIEGKIIAKNQMPKDASIVQVQFPGLDFKEENALFGLFYSKYNGYYVYAGNKKGNNKWSVGVKIPNGINHIHVTIKKWDKGNVIPIDNELLISKDLFYSKLIMTGHENREKELTMLRERILATATEIKQSAANGINSISYKLGYAILHSMKSYRNFINLPKTLYLINKERMVRVKKKQVTDKHINPETIKATPIPLTPNAIKHQKYIHGVSVITPSFIGEKTINRYLDSFVSQTLDKDKFELIIVINGEKDNTSNIIKKFCKKNPDLKIKILTLEEANVSEARNVGIMEANNRYITFVDDDDFISSGYLKSMLDNASIDTIVVNNIADIDEHNGSINYYPHNSEQLIKASTMDSINARDISGIATMTVCKLIPTYLAKNNFFERDLRSGEDVVFFSDLLTKNNFKYVINKKEHYYRLVREGSVSRKNMSYDFNVIQRLMVIKKLDNMIGDNNKRDSSFIRAKINAQSGFINRYLLENPKEHSNVINKIRSLGINNLDYQKVNKNLSKSLVISYCFPPSVDTSAIVIMKRILMKGDVVDVVSNNMSSVRSMDANLFKLVESYVGIHKITQTPTSFSNWESINKFSDEVVKFATNKYDRVYSRSMWPASHFAAFEIKNKYPDIQWIAEFSDPILFDINSCKREGEITDHKYLKRISKKMSDSGYLGGISNIFELCELLPYVFADIIIVTNKNQAKYMLNMFPGMTIEFKDKINKKIKILEHPTLGIEYYDMVNCNYHLDNSKVNIGYFGAFYGNRNMNYLIQALSESGIKNIIFHLFTNDDVSELKKMIGGYEVSDCFIINDYVPYLEFLSISNKFDYLLINDTETAGKKFINPYLPSKLSDYQGAKAKIFALAERGSILWSKDDIDIRCNLNDVEEIKLALNKLSKSAVHK